MDIEIDEMTDEMTDEEFQALYAEYRDDVPFVVPVGADDRCLAWLVFEKHEGVNYPELLGVFNGNYEGADDEAYNLWLEGRDIYVEGRQ
jgi:hypothetical protein